MGRRKWDGWFWENITSSKIGDEKVAIELMKLYITNECSFFSLSPIIHVSPNISLFCANVQPLSFSGDLVPNNRQPRICMENARGVIRALLQQPQKPQGCLLLPWKQSKLSLLRPCFAQVYLI